MSRGEVGRATPRGRTVPFMGISIAFMLVALLVGIFRLMAQNGVGPAELSQLYGLHPLLMVFGFIGGIIVTERIAGVELLPHSSETSLSLAIPPFIFAGMLTEAAGYLLDFAPLRYAGAAMLAISASLFLWLLASFYKAGREKTSVLFMIVSAFALLSSSALSAFSLPAGNVGFVMLLLSFPVVFVLGERVELTSLATHMATDRFLPALFFSGAAVALFGIGAFFPTTASDLTESVAFVMLAVTFAFILMAERKAHTKSVVSPFSRYVSRHAALAYVWGLTGSTFGIAYALFHLFVFYDAFIHSLALGFIGLMFLAHGPIILPMVVRRQFDNAKLSYSPLAILSLAITLRIGAELTLLQGYSWSLELLVATSGWLVLAAVLAFFAEIVRGMGRRPQADPSGLTTNSSQTSPRVQVATPITKEDSRKEGNKSHLLRKARIIDVLTFLAVILVSPASVVLSFPLGVMPQVWVAVWLRYVVLFILLAIGLALFGFDASNRYRLDADKPNGPPFW